MSVKITYYLEVISSWCYWGEPTWEKLKTHFRSQPVEFDWKLALMDASGLPLSEAQIQWFYRRSGPIVRSPFMLNSGWFDLGRAEYLPPNLVALAAKELGVTDDTVRLAIAQAGLRAGQKVGDWDVSFAVACQAAPQLDRHKLKAHAQSPELEERARQTTREFHALSVSQRPAFLLESNIGDRAIFSGLIHFEPLASTVEAMLADSAAYASHAAHFGSPPSQ